jgi:hypothetical protein
VNNDPVNYIDPWGLFSLTDVWTGITAWNYEGRDARNNNIESIDTITNEEQGWRQDLRDTFHQDGDNYHDDKYTHPDGREVVIDGATGKMVTEGATRGTYNYVDPGVAPENRYDIAGWAEFGARGVGHFFADILPWAILGIDRPNSRTGCAN